MHVWLWSPLLWQMSKHGQLYLEFIKVHASLHMDMPVTNSSKTTSSQDRTLALIMQDMLVVMYDHQLVPTYQPTATGRDL